MAIKSRSVPRGWDRASPILQRISRARPRAGPGPLSGPSWGAVHWHRGTVVVIGNRYHIGSEGRRPQK